MRKLTALTLALSLSAAGQAFAGEPHATHAAPSHVVAPVKEILEAKQNAQQAKQNVQQQAQQTVQQAKMQAQQQAQQAVQQAKSHEGNTNGCPGPGTCSASGPTTLIQYYTRGLPVLDAVAGDAKKIEENPGAIGETIAKIDDAKITEAEKTAAKKTEVIDTVKTADAPNSGVANAVATAESQNATSK